MNSFEGQEQIPAVGGVRHQRLHDGEDLGQDLEIDKSLDHVPEIGFVPDRDPEIDQKRKRSLGNHLGRRNRLETDPGLEIGAGNDDRRLLHHREVVGRNVDPNQETRATLKKSGGVQVIIIPKTYSSKLLNGLLPTGITKMYFS